MFNETEKKIIAFRDARDWSQFHNPRTLATSISIENVELLENSWRPKSLALV